LTATEDEVNIALDVTALIKMAALVIKESVVGAEEGAVIERYFVS
jgi:hypothetical protein